MEEQVISIIKDNVVHDNREIKPDDQLSTLGINSLDLVEIIIQLEEDFRINIPDDEADSWKTVGDVIQSVRNHIAGRK